VTVRPSCISSATIKEQRPVAAVAGRFTQDAST
jgi:hypothetical protein